MKTVNPPRPKQAAGEKPLLQRNCKNRSMLTVVCCVPVLVEFPNLFCYGCGVLRLYDHLECVGEGDRVNINLQVGVFLALCQHNLHQQFLVVGEQ